MKTRTAPKPVVYPESDGKPMAESDIHRDEMVRIIQTLQDAFERPDIYVSGNLLLYYEEGNPRAVVAPDVFVVKGVARRQRPLYKLWEEGVGPVVVLEVTSRSTRREDLSRKRALYARLSVREYFLYDPLGEYLRPALQGFRLVAGEYVPMETDAEGALLSDELGMRLLLQDGRLRLFDRQTGTALLDRAERIAAEAGARRAAEARIAELEALLRDRQLPSNDTQDRASPDSSAL